MFVIRKLALVCACALLLLSSVGLSAQRSVRAEGAPINITFEFSPAKASYAPGENLTINFTAVNTMPKGDFMYDDLAYMEKITNISAHFGWMAPNAFAWSNVTGTSSWLAPDGMGAGVYALRISVPANATLQTYSYFFRIEYMSHTQWGNITYTWGAALTYHDFVVTNYPGAVNYLPYVTFEFSPGKVAYEPGENLTINFTAVNTMPAGDYAYDDLAYMEKIMNVSAHFGWMAPNESAWNNVSGTSSWLAPDGRGTGIYALRISVPANVTLQTYSYFFRIEYMSHTAAGNRTYIWGANLTYHDFVVTNRPVSVDYLPYIAMIATALAAVSIGAILYWRRGKGTETGIAGAAAVHATSEMSAQQGGVVTYPVIRATPGEGFPVEKGFIYLVKEKRPNISFAMFKEATNHGAKGMLVAREHPNRLKQMHEFEAAKILWLTRRVGIDHIDPTELSLLSLEITKFVQGMPKSVVLLEGLEYIITQNDFETVLRFVNHLHDFVLAHDCAVIIIIDPRVLSTRELALLERSARIVEPMSEKVEAREIPSDEAFA
jgi:hypothetical protein